MILRELPHRQLAAPTAGGEAFRRWFYARWGRENAVILGDATRADFPLFTQTLSVKRAWNGREDYFLPGRDLAVDDDHYLVLNEGARYGSRISSTRAITSLGVFFRPGLAAEVVTALRQDGRDMLDDPHPSPQLPAFAEHLRPLAQEGSDAIGRALAALREAVRAGEDDDDWLEERLHELAALLLRAEPGWRARSQRLADMGRSTHAELLDRADHAHDFIQTHHSESLTLDDIARAARLSKFHLVRVVRQVHGATPMTLVVRARTRTALRLLADPSLSLEDVAASSGFGSRQTLFRHLRRHCGTGGLALRGRLPR